MFTGGSRLKSLSQLSAPFHRTLAPHRSSHSAHDLSGPTSLILSLSGLETHSYIISLLYFQLFGVLVAVLVGYATRISSWFLLFFKYILIFISSSCVSCSLLLNVIIKLNHNWTLIYNFIMTITHSHVKIYKYASPSLFKPFNTRPLQDHLHCSLPTH